MEHTVQFKDPSASGQLPGDGNTAFFRRIKPGVWLMKTSADYSTLGANAFVGHCPGNDTVIVQAADATPGRLSPSIGPSSSHGATVPSTAQTGDEGERFTPLRRQDRAGQWHNSPR
jgi:hypothetical protein